MVLPTKTSIKWLVFWDYKSEDRERHSRGDYKNYRHDDSNVFGIAISGSSANARIQKSCDTGTEEQRVEKVHMLNCNLQRELLSHSC